MNKIIEFFNSELWFWIHLSIGFVATFLLVLNFFIGRIRLRREAYPNYKPVLSEQRPENYKEDKLNDNN